MSPEIQAALSPALVSDPSLVARALSGDPRAFESLVRRYNQRVFRTARAVLGNDTEAQDAAQQAWLAIYVNLAQWNASGSFSSWALRIVVRSSLRRKSTMTRDDVREDTEITSPVPGPEDETHRLEMRRVLERAIDALPSTLRTVLILADVEGLSGPEIGEAVGASEEAVRVRLHRARRALRASITDGFEAQRPELYPFLGARCDVITHAVMSSITAEKTPT